MSDLNWRIATVGGVPIYLHWSFWALPLWYLVWGIQDGLSGLSLLAIPLLITLGMLLTIVPHEIGHAWVGKLCGVSTRNITIYPLGGAAFLEQPPKSPLEDIAISLAGPLMNFLSVGLYVGVLLVLDAPLLSPFSLLEGGLSHLPYGIRVIYWLIFINTYMGAFNLLPAFPLDGGHVLRAFLAVHFSYLLATRVAFLSGLIFMAIAIAGGYLLWEDPLLILMGVLVGVSAFAEWFQVETRTVEEGVVRAFPILFAHETIESALKALSSSEANMVLVISDSSSDNWKPVAILSRNQLAQALASGFPLTTPLAKLAKDKVLVVPPDANLNKVKRIMDKYGIRFILVLRDARVVGILDSQNLP